VCAPVGRGPNDRGLSRKHVMEAAHNSLRRLDTDYVDLYQAHRYDERTPLEETLRAFDDLVRQGKVLYVGVSEWTAEQITAALRIAGEMGLDRIVANQPQYNMLWRVVEAEVLPLCAREGIGQLAWSPLAQGLLTGKYRPGEPLPAGSRAEGPARSQFSVGALDDDVLTRIARLGEIARDLDITMPQLALAWVLRDPAVSSAIVGATRPEQIVGTAAASGIDLDDEAVARIDEILDPIVERDPARIPAHPTDYRK
jgi:aryl-alcohol dehydrogenase-like predicted oxidoreductase